ncbi:DUF58 domain-containing protein [Eisenibacter elegans]|uniref:DUF58 domain-containing protein n=1 Tax=Eisenibacter elegans TaxID=997 RepID=UPI0004246FCF|nr:DUF58 domain-containing protein [Eisenibacter elegans]
MAKRNAPTLSLSQIREFGNIEFLAKQMVEGFITGLHRSPFHGFSVEFAEHRLYNNGESTRHIDWKVFAKTDRLYTKRYEEETNLRAHLLLDVSSSMYYPTHNYGKLTFSVMAAAALMYMLQQQRDAVGMTTFSDEILEQTPVKSTPSHIHKCFLSLERLLHSQPPTCRSAVTDTLHQIAQKIQRRSLVILFSDMLDNSDQAEQLFSALQHLRHNHHEVLIFHVADRQTEQAFAFDDRPYEFIDLETGQKIRLQPADIREQYLRKQAAFMQDLKLRCGQFRIDLIEADIAQPFEQILYAYLVKRSKVN